MTALLPDNAGNIALQCNVRGMGGAHDLAIRV
jgi:hypothetical protein